VPSVRISWSSGPAAIPILKLAPHKGFHLLEAPTELPSCIRIDSSHQPINEFIYLGPILLVYKRAVSAIVLKCG